MITPVSEESLKRLEDVAKLMSPTNLNRDTTFAVIAELRLLRRAADAAEAFIGEPHWPPAHRVRAALRDAGRLVREGARSYEPMAAKEFDAEFLRSLAGQMGKDAVRSLVDERREAMGLLRQWLRESDPSSAPMARTDTEMFLATALPDVEPST